MPTSGKRIASPSAKAKPTPQSRAAKAPKTAPSKSKSAPAKAHRDGAEGGGEPQVFGSTALDGLDAGAILVEAIASSPAGVAVFGRGKRLLYCNAAWGRLAPGVKAFVTPGSVLPDIVRAARTSGLYPEPPEGWDAWEARYLGFAEASGDAPAELRLPDGAWVRLRGQRTPTGNYVVTFVNIDPQKQRERELAESEAKFSAIVGAMDDGIALVDGQGRLAVWNRRFAELQDFPPAMFEPGRPAVDFVRCAVERGDFGPVDDVEAETAARLAVLQRGDGARYARRTPQGRFVEYSYRKLDDGSILCRHRDFTELKESEEIAAAAHATLQQAIEALSDGVAVWSADDRLLACNAVYRRAMMDLPPAVEPGRTIEEGLRAVANGPRPPAPPDQRDDWVRRMLALHRNPGMQVEARTGATTWARISTHRTSSGGLVTLMTDISALKQRERDLGAAEAAAAAAHASLRDAVESLADGVAVWDGDDRLVVCNAGYRRAMFDLPEAIEPGRTVEEGLRAVAAARRPAMDAPAQDAWVRMMLDLHHTPGSTIETRVGKASWIRISSSRTGGGGKTTLITDISALKGRETELAKTQETLQTILDNMDDGVMLFDPDFRWVMANRQLMEFQRFPKDVAHPGADARDILRFQARRGDFGPVKDDEELERMVEQRAAMMLKPGGNRYQRRTASGRTIDFNFKPLSDGRMLALYRDVTDIVEAQQEADSARLRLLEAIAAVPDGVAFYDAEERLTLCNDAFRVFARQTEAIVRRGASIDQAVRAAAMGGAAPPGRTEEWIASTLVALRAGEPITFVYGPHQWARMIARKTADGRLSVVIADITAERNRERDLRKAQADAEASRRRLDVAIDSQPGGFALYDADLRLLMCNQFVREMWPEVPELASPGVLFEDALRAAVARGETQRRTPEEAERWIAENVAYMRNPSGPVEARYRGGRLILTEARRTPDGDTVAVYVDITAERRRESELRKAQEEIEAARQQTATVLDNMADGVMLFDAEDRLRYYNPVVKRLQNFSDEDLAGSPSAWELGRMQARRGDFGKVWREDVEGFVSTVLTPLLRTRGASAQRRTRDGQWMDSNFYPLPGGGTLVAVRDITAVKESEAAAVRERDAADVARQQLDDVLQSISAGVMVLDAQERLVLCNPAFRRFMHQLPEIVTPGARLEDGVRAAAYRKPVGAAPPGQEEAWIAAMLARMRSGEVAHAPYGPGQWARLVSHQTEDGGRIVVIADVTEERQRERELKKAFEAAEAARLAAEEADRAKSTFLATMSHEIRTPMNGVLGMIEVLERSGASAEQRQALGVVRESAGALLRIIDDVLDFSKIEAGRLDLERVPAPLQEIVEGVAETLGVQARRKGLALSTFVDPSVPARLIGDPVRIRQILFNLLGNAIKFTERGHVRVRVLPDPDRAAGEGRFALKLAVEDSGIGMDEEQRARLFQPFTQGDSTTTRRFGGTGLGLSIVRRLCRSMGGDVTVESAPGRGSTFVAALTLECEDPSPPQEADLSGASFIVSLPDRVERADVAATLRALGAEAAESKVDAGFRGVLALGPQPTLVRLADWPEAGEAPDSRVLHRPWRRAALLRAACEALGREPPSTLAEAAAPDALPTPGEGLPDGPRTRSPVLVVDDHPINRQVILRQLALLGYETDSAADGAEAFAKWRGGGYALVLTDCHMPVMDGFELTRQIRRTEQGRGEARTPIVAITANALAGEADRCIAAGMDAYLSKPAPIDALRVTLAKWLPADPEAPAPALAAPSATAQEDALDGRVLAELFGDDRATIDPLLEEFVASARAAEPEIAQAAREAQHDRIAAAAHRIKGSARMVGARPLAAAAEALEKAGRARDLPAARAALPAFSREIARVSAAVEARGAG